MSGDDSRRLDESQMSRRQLLEKASRTIAKGRARARTLAGLWHMMLGTCGVGHRYIWAP